MSQSCTLTLLSTRSASTVLFSRSQVAILPRIVGITVLEMIREFNRAQGIVMDM